MSHQKRYVIVRTYSAGVFADHTKNELELSFNVDQWMHIACKAFYVLAIWRAS